MMHEWSAVLNIPVLERDCVRVCSLHFSSSDFDANGKLKETAIPRHELANSAAHQMSDTDTDDNRSCDSVYSYDNVVGHDYASDEVPADDSVADMNLGGGGDFAMGAGGGEGGTVESALQEVEEAASNIPSGGKDEGIGEVRRKLRSMRVK